MKETSFLIVRATESKYSGENSCDEGNSDVDQSTEDVTDNNDNGSHQQQASSESPLFIQLAPLCENEDPRRDAILLDELGLFLQKYETTVKFVPQVACIRSTTLLQGEL